MVGIWHQDQYYLPDCMSAWIALVDVDDGNGPLGVQPGYILSSRAIAGGRDKGEIRDRLLSQIPLGRLSVPEDCAKVVEFLVTDLSDYVTGQCIPICGGYVAF
ncbi:MAG: SDR family oxidoreductase [Chloroflexota bacterium]